MIISSNLILISPYPLFSLFIWYATNFANIFSVRQTIAISLFVFSWKFIEEKKLWRFLITIAIAMSFHLTAFVVIPTYFIWHRYFSARFYIIVLSILTLISFSSEGLMQNILDQSLSLNNKVLQLNEKIKNEKRIELER